jgi:uncharacterized protein YqeY
MHMSLSLQLSNEQIVAMKAKDAQKLSVLRMINAAVKTAQIDSDHDLTDVEVQDIIRRQVKQLTDASADFATAKRDDLVAQNQAEIAILASYLPAQLSEADVTAKAQQIVDELRAAGEINVGLAMAAVMKELKGQADGNMVRTVVTKLIS